MATFHVSRLKRVDDRVRNLLYGYIRGIEKELLSAHEHDVFYIIPDLVTSTCLLFYFIDQVFKDISAKLKQSGDHNNTISSNRSVGQRNWDAVAYGEKWIDSMSKKLYSWSIHIDEFRIKQTVQQGAFQNTSGSGAIAIGFITNLHHQNVNRDWDNEHSYLFTTEGGVSRNGHYVKDCGLRSRTGDTLTLVLDMSGGGKIVCEKNEHAQRYEIFSQLKQETDLKYRLALSINGCHSVTFAVKETGT